MEINQTEILTIHSVITISLNNDRIKSFNFIIESNTINAVRDDNGSRTLIRPNPNLRVWILIFWTL